MKIGKNKKRKIYLHRKKKEKKKKTEKVFFLFPIVAAWLSTLPPLQYRQEDEWEWALFVIFSDALIFLLSRSDSHSCFPFCSHTDFSCDWKVPWEFKSTQKDIIFYLKKEMIMTNYIQRKWKRKISFNSHQLFNRSFSSEPDTSMLSVNKLPDSGWNSCNLKSSRLPNNESRLVRTLTQTLRGERKRREKAFVSFSSFIVGSRRREKLFSTSSSSSFVER